MTCEGRCLLKTDGFTNSMDIWEQKMLTFKGKWQLNKHD